MAKKKNIKEKSIEETLWQSCDKLRGSVEPAEYKHVVLGLKRGVHHILRYFERVVH